jgi:PST family polysaccharide transporter
MDRAPDSPATPSGAPLPANRGLAPAVRRSTWGVAAGQIASQCISLGVLAVLYRLIVPADFGLLGMALTWIALVRLLGALGLGVAVVQRPEMSDAELSALFWVNLLIAAGASLLGAALAPLVALFYGVAELTSVAAALAGTTFVSAVGVLHQALLERHLRLGRLAALRVAAQVIGGGAAIAAAVQGWGVWALVVQQYAEWGSLALLCWLADPWRPVWLKRTAVTSELVRFGGFYTASGLMAYLATTADKIVLARLGAAGERELGFYTQAFSLMMRPVYLVTTPLAGIMLAVLARSAHDPPEYRRLLLEFLRLIGWLLFPAGVGMVLVADDLVLVLGGSQWQPAGALLVALAPAILVQGFFNVAGSIFGSAGRAKELLLGSAVVALVLCQAFVVGRFMGERFGPSDAGPALGVAWSYSLASIGVLFVPFMLYCLHNVGVRLRDLLAVLRAPLLAALAMGCVVLLVARSLRSHEQLPVLARLLVEVSVGVAIYALLAYREIARWRVRRPDLAPPAPDATM